MPLVRLLFSLCLLTFLCTSGRAQLQIGNDILGNKPNYDIGVSLAISKDGQRVVVGSPGADRPEGHVKVYELSNGEWAQLGQNFGGRGMSTVGQSVAISADGNRLAYSVGGTNSLPGQVRIHVWDGQEWAEETILEGSDGGNDDSFGHALALSEDGKTLIVGTPYRATDAAGANAGGVNVFRLGDSWTDITGDFIEGGNNENVGFAVAISANGRGLGHGPVYPAVGTLLSVLAPNHLPPVTITSLLKFHPLCAHIIIWFSPCWRPPKRKPLPPSNSTSPT